MKNKITLIFVFATAFLNAQQKTTGQLNFVAGLSAELNLNNGTSLATLVISGPSDRWFGFKLGSFPTAMSAGVDGVYYNGTGLTDGNGGTLTADATQNWTLVSNDVVGLTRTITATRPFNTGDANDYIINYANTNIDVAAAHGDIPNDFTIAYHGVNKSKFLDTPLNILGVEDFSLKTATLYPNPSTGNFTIATKTYLNSVDVYNINGVFIKTFKVDDTSENVEFTITGLPVGVYLLELKNETEKSWKKVIIE
jgi:hypothetical protein